MNIKLAVARSTNIEDQVHMRTSPIFRSVGLPV